MTIENYINKYEIYLITITQCVIVYIEEIIMTIKELREKTGLSQNQFAKKYKLSIRQVQSWEQGQRNTPRTILYMLERLINEDYKEQKND